MKYKILMAVSILVLTATSTPVLGNGGPTLVDACGVASSYEGETILVTADIVDTSIINRPSSPTNCLFITHDDVTLDCQGYRLTHSGNGRTRGVWVAGNRVTVQNCELYGIWLNGIIYWETRDGVVLNNKLVANRWGIGVMSSEGAWIEGNKVDAAFNAGIQIFRSISSWVYDNTVHGSGWAGVMLNDPWNDPQDPGGADGNYVIGNQVNLNGLYGIFIADDSDDNIVFGNSINKNDGIGIAALDTSDANEIEKNTANRNDVGIYNEGSNNFDGNRCHKNMTEDSIPDGLCK